MTRSGLAYEVQTLALPTDATDGSVSEFLLPTPSALESTPTDGFVDEVRENLADPHKRLYLPGRKWHAQRTLSRIAPALLPTPGAWLGRRPENAMADPEREKSRENEGLRGKRSIELPDAIAAEVRLLPTPQSSDGDGGRLDRNPETLETGRRPSGSKASVPLATAIDKDVRLLPTPHAGLGEHRRDNGQDPEKRRKQGRQVSLADVVRYETPRLLPTPTTQDGENCGGPSQQERNTPPLNAVVTKLLPTPTAGDSKASGSRNLEGSQAHEGVSLTDAVRFGNSRTPRLLPTPVAGDGEGGRTSKGKDRPDEAGLAGRVKLLPTPTAQEMNPGAGGELRAAITHGESRRSESETDTMGRPIRKGRDPLLPTPRAVTGRSSRRAMVENQQWSAPSLEQAVELAEGTLPREFQTWEEVPGWSGEPTNQPSDDGSSPSDDPLPGQLMIGDA